MTIAYSIIGSSNLALKLKLLALMAQQSTATVMTISPQEPAQPFSLQDGHGKKKAQWKTEIRGRKKK